MIPIVIPVYGRQDLTERCLKSIHEHTPLPHRVVIVDNASPDNTLSWLTLTQPDVAVIQVPENVGWGRGANIGAAMLDTELVVQLNNDTEVTEGWLEPLVAAVAQDGVGMASSRLVNPDGSLQHAGIRLFFDDNGVLTAQNVAEEREAGPVQCASMACAIFRMDAWRSIGGIDPKFRNGYEDVDACLRLILSGWKIMYVPESTVMHVQHGSGEERWARVGENIRLLHERWASRMRTA